MATTEFFNIAKPDARTEPPKQTLAEALLSVAQGTDQIDALLRAVHQSLDEKSNVGHGHSIEQIAGLTSALDGKMPASRTFALNDLIDVETGASPPQNYLLAYVVDRWVPASAVSLLGQHGHTIGQITGLTAALEEISDNFETVEEQIARAVPAGATLPFARNTPPTGWLKANGAAVSRTAYAALFAAIGTTFGAGDGSTTFNLPDLRGEFVRGWDDGRGVDSGRALGSAQADQNKSHSHSGTTGNAGAHNHSGSTNSTGAHTHTIQGRLTGSGGSISGTFASLFTGDDRQYSSGWNNATNTRTASAGGHSHSLTINNGGNHNHPFTTSTEGGNEARPRNVAMLMCIKY